MIAHPAIDFGVMSFQIRPGCPGQDLLLPPDDVSVRCAPDRYRPLYVIAALRLNNPECHTG
jgi:hypothetical protein